MKKIIAVLLVLVITLGAVSVSSFAAFDKDSEKLFFNADGKFKIMMVNDTQDVGKNANKMMIDFFTKALDSEKPDLVVFVGDQLSETYIFPTKEDFKIAIDNVCKPLEERKIPFLVTMGNHDHDREKTMVEKEQYEIYNSYSMCINTENGPFDDPFTCSKLVYSRAGKAKLNLYVVDSNNKNSDGIYEGLTADQVKFIKDTAAANKMINGGNALPSLSFQHIPCKEIYQFVKEAKISDEDSVFSQDTLKWYNLDRTKVESGEMGETPNTIDLDDGEYKAWVEDGDIIGAFFGHDHINTFIGTTEDGIRLGYNGGAGFRAYGDKQNRVVRIFELDESDVSAYTTRLVTYGDLGGQVGFRFNDYLNYSTLSIVFKVIYRLLFDIVN